MFLNEPQPTPYDLHFELFGFPVRISPYFWLMALIMGSSAGGTLILIWGLVLFVSILIHELGHAFAMRHFGRPARIVLTMMGGLAIEDNGSDAWGNFRSSSKPRTTYEQVVICFAGPLAGFCLAALVCVVVILLKGRVQVEMVRWRWLSFPDVEAVLPMHLARNDNLRFFVRQMLFVNIFWGIINLFPVFPLDGGQIGRALFVRQDPWRGIEKSLWLSVFTGATLAVFGLIAMESMYMGMLFGSLAIGSYQQLAQMGGGQRGGW